VTVLFWLGFIAVTTIIAVSFWLYASAGAHHSAPPHGASEIAKGDRLAIAGARP
jgi:hypothetical protein